MNDVALNDHATEGQVFYGKPLAFNEKRHMYFWDGQHIPSVTTILNRCIAKPALIQWAATCAIDDLRRTKDRWACLGPSGMGFDEGEFERACEEARVAHRRIKEEAGDIGTLIHKYARAAMDPSLPTVPLPENAQAQRAAGAFDDWLVERKVEPIALERRVMSKRYGYAGTCDFFGHIDGELCVLDFKTGNGVYPEAWLQLAAYELALLEEMEIARKPFVRWVIHLDKNTGECKPHRQEMSPLHTGAWVTVCILDRQLRDVEADLKRKAA